jgi:trehalose 6-phosphate phosphatase
VEHATDDVAELARLLDPLRERPGETALLTDVDGTIAPVVLRPEDAAVLPDARALLERLADRYALVACISGRQALDARRLVGVDGITYAGNHGLEVLLPNESEPRPDPSLDGHERDARRFVESLDHAELESLGLRVEDKGVIQALHWRGSPTESAAEARAHEVAADAEWRGLGARWGRKVLEIRPPVQLGKGEAIEHLLQGRGVKNAMYAGDDHTDIDAFRALRGLHDAGTLDVVVCVGVNSVEAPPALAEEADLVVNDPEAFVELLAGLAE